MERAAQLAINSNSTLVETETEDRPDIPHPAYDRMAVRRKKMRMVYMGTEAIRDAMTEVVPQMPGESDLHYLVRYKLAAFQNATALTIAACVGMLTDEDPALVQTDNPKELLDLAENVDRKGNSFAMFTQELFLEGLIDGYDGILVDYTRPSLNLIQRLKNVSQAAVNAILNRTQLDSADANALGLRPYFILVRAEDIFKPVYAYVDGVKVLVLQVFREVKQERKGLFGTRNKVQYRVYTNTNGVIEVQVWASKTPGTPPEVVEQPIVIKNQTEIPWAPFPAGDYIGPDEWKPPFYDLADLNIEHHNLRTNILSLINDGLIPTLVRIGAKPTKDKDGKDVWPPISLGPSKTIEVPFYQGMPNIPIYWLSPDPAVIGPAQAQLATLTAAMASAGAAFLASETRAAETAEGKRLDSAAKRATLKSVRNKGKDCLERAWGYAGNFAGVKAGSVFLTDNFTGEGIDPLILAQALASYMAGGLSLEEFRTVWKTGKLPEDFNTRDDSMVGTAFARVDASLQDPNAPLARSTSSTIPVVKGRVTGKTAA